MPPYGYLLEVHVVVLLRAIVLFKFGSVNTRASADFMDTAGLYVVGMVFFFAVLILILSISMRVTSSLEY